MCDRQLASRDDYSSFSVLGLAILIIISGCIILANVSVRRLFTQHLRRRKDVSKEGTWDAFDILNLKIDEALAGTAAVREQAERFDLQHIDSKSNVHMTYEAESSICWKVCLFDIQVVFAGMFCSHQSSAQPSCGQHAACPGCLTCRHPWQNHSSAPEYPCNRACQCS